MEEDDMSTNDFSLNQETLKELLHYDPETGIFTRKEIPRGYFKTNANYALTNSRVKDKKANIKEGGIFILGKRYKAHDIACLYMNGCFPKGRMIHEKGDANNCAWKYLSDDKYTKNDVTQDYLKNIFDYNKATGLLTWKERPVGHFKNSQAHKTWNKRFSRKMAGVKAIGKSGKTYSFVVVDGRRYSTHRLIYFMMTGVWPIEIDHVNGCGTDNRWENITNSTRVDNAKNLRKPSTNTSGCVGVHWVKCRNKWMAYIDYNGERINLGRFKNKLDAIQARKEAEIKYGYHPNHGKERPL